MGGEENNSFEKWVKLGNKVSTNCATGDGVARAFFTINTTIKEVTTFIGKTFANSWSQGAGMGCAALNSLAEGAKRIDK